MRLILLFLLVALAAAQECTMDCMGVCNGTAFLDADGGCCDITEKGCDGFCSDKRIDRCGVCGGGDKDFDIVTNMCCNATDRDCAGVCHGTGVPDSCGVCNGNDAGKDSTGVCCTDEERDCNGLCHGGARNDACGVCGGDGSTCCGTHGKCNGHGLCTRHDDVGICMCELGWTGVHCIVAQSMCPLEG